MPASFSVIKRLHLKHLPKVIARAQRIQPKQPEMLIPLETIGITNETKILFTDQWQFARIGDQGYVVKLENGVADIRQYNGQRPGLARGEWISAVEICPNCDARGTEQKIAEDADGTTYVLAERHRLCGWIVEVN